MKKRIRYSRMENTLNEIISTLKIPGWGFSNRDIIKIGNMIELRNGILRITPIDDELSTYIKIGKFDKIIVPFIISALDLVRCDDLNEVDFVSSYDLDIVKRTGIVKSTINGVYMELKFINDADTYEFFKDDENIFKLSQTYKSTNIITNKFLEEIFELYL